MLRIEGYELDLWRRDRILAIILPGVASITLALTAINVVQGKSMGMKVVAEGVESADQRARLLEMGRDLRQGYYSARPLPGEAAKLLLAGSLSSLGNGSREQQDGT